jgi:hypothetical protein
MKIANWLRAKLLFALALIQTLYFLKRAVRFFANIAGMTKAIMGSVVLIVVIVVLDTRVVPLLINGSDGGIGEATLPILQAALLIAGIFSAIGIIYYTATHFSSTADGK